MPIITNVCEFEFSLNKVYSIQYYVIKFVSDLRYVVGFLWVLRISSTNITDRLDITKMLLKVALITIIPPLEIKLCYFTQYQLD